MQSHAELKAAVAQCQVKLVVSFFAMRFPPFSFPWQVLQ